MVSASWEKVDKFYIVFVFCVIMMAVLIIISFRGVFGAYLTAFDVGTREESELKIDKNKLEEAYLWAMTKKTLPLEVRE